MSELPRSRLLVHVGIIVSRLSPVRRPNFPAAINANALFMTAWVFEVRHCRTLLTGVKKKTKLQTYTEPQAGINLLLCVVSTP
jgi:hypothetical protein